MSVSAAATKPVSASRFAQLLAGYERVSRNAGGSYRSLEALLREFELIAASCRGGATRVALPGVNRFEPLLTEYESLIEKARRRQEMTAEDFNLLEVMNLAGDELRHSRLLAWLLDADVRHGTHAQGNLGFRLFLEEFESVGLKPSYADCRYRVRREVSGDESCVDICVESAGKFVIYIENKIWSDEGDRQTIREWNDVQKLAKKTGTPSNAVHGLFLSPEGRQPLDAHFQPISYRGIANILDRFATESKPEDVKLFAKHYATALRRCIVVEREKEEHEDEETAE